MRKYWSFFRLRFVNGLQYRAAAWAGVATQFAWGFMSILLYAAFYRENAAVFPMAFAGLTNYIWFQQAFLAIFMIWGLDNSIFQSITDGGVAYELTRPMDLYNMWFVKNMAMRVAGVSLRCLPILLVAALLPAPYGLSLPAGPMALVMFVLTMLLSLMVVVAFCMLLYISTFFTLSSMGVRITAMSISGFLMGGVVPLPFLPEGPRTAVELLPFASMQNLPLLVYSGHVAGEELLVKVLLQLFWLLALVVLGRLWMKKALRRVVAQGG